MDTILLIIQLTTAFLLGAIIGLERNMHGSPAGVRTYAAVCLGSCIFGILSTHAQGPSFYPSNADPTRIAAQIVSGIGFLGAGVIFRSGFTMVGLTTAATIWATAAIGLGIAFGMYWVAGYATFLIVILLSLNEWSFWIKFKDKIQKNKTTNNIPPEGNP